MSVLFLVPVQFRCDGCGLKAMGTCGVTETRRALVPNIGEPFPPEGWTHIRLLDSSTCPKCHSALAKALKKKTRQPLDTDPRDS